MLERPTVELQTNSLLTRAEIAAFQSSQCTILLKQRGGRLGNSMFHFASAYGLARTHACRLYLKDAVLAELLTSFQINISFAITTPEANKIKNVVRKYSVCSFYSELMVPNAVTHLEIQGPWQAFGHFIRFSDEIRQQFLFQSAIMSPVDTFFRLVLNSAITCQNQNPTDETVSNRNCSIWRHVSVERTQYIRQVNVTFGEVKERLLKSVFTWIAIHIRRGDRMGISSSHHFILSGMRYYAKKYPLPIFVIPSDDKPYCHKTFKHLGNVIITPDFFTPDEDLAALASCQHSILTLGTFGWWAAFLAKGDVYHDVKYKTKICHNCTCSKENLYPPWFMFSNVT